MEFIDEAAKALDLDPISLLNVPIDILASAVTVRRTQMLRSKKRLEESGEVDLYSKTSSDKELEKMAKEMSGISPSDKRYTGKQDSGMTQLEYLNNQYNDNASV